MLAHILLNVERQIVKNNKEILYLIYGTNKML